MNQSTTETINEPEQSESLSTDSFTPLMRTVLATRLANIGRRTLQLMKFSSTFRNNALLSF